jgi:phenylalanyl-tRNA synthetase beta chain
MLFLKSWLEEYIDLIGITNETIAEKITLKSSEVEEIRVISDYFDGKILVGKIENLVKHPDADKLNVFDVLIGENKRVKIVSAAENARDGLMIPVALNGARLGNLTIVPRKMRGIESQGMCCGMSELMLETEHSSGLWELSSLLQEDMIGKSICKALPEYFPQEVLFDIKVLPNRIGVIGSYVGMAREIALCLGEMKRLKPLAKRLGNATEFLKTVVENIGFEENPNALSFSFQDTTNITNSFALFDMKIQREGEYRPPHELQKRMYLSGINMIGGFADVSNYLLFDVGQPTHFFSKQKVIDVCGATPDWRIERLETATEFAGLGQLKQAILKPNLPVLVDSDENILALPGISGGESTKLDVEENEVIVEIANFQSEDIARGSFMQKYRSDGSKVWAGGVNQQMTFAALLRLREQVGTSLHVSPILFWSKKSGVIESLTDFVDEFEPVNISIDLEYLASRLDGRGVEYWSPILTETLNQVGIFDGKKLEVETFYSNLVTQDDVLEEVVRLVGLENLEKEELVLSTKIDNTGVHNRIRKLKNVMVEFGFDEVLTRPFVGEIMVSEIAKTPRVLKPYRSHEPFVRDNLFYSLIGCVGRNMKDGHKSPKIFEINSFFLIEKGLIKEQKELQAICVGDDPYLLTSLAHEIWNKTSRKPVVEFKDLGSPETVGKGFWYETNVHDEPWISVSEVSNSVKKKFEIPLNKKVWSLNVLLSFWDGTFFDYKQYQDESDYPISRRSYTFVMEKTRTWDSVRKVIDGIDTNGFKTVVSPSERFEKDGKDTLTLNIEYVSYEKTITKEEIEEFEKEMIEKLGE